MRSAIGQDRRRAFGPGGNETDTCALVRCQVWVASGAYDAPDKQDSSAVSLVLAAQHRRVQQLTIRPRRILHPRVLQHPATRRESGVPDCSAPPSVLSR